jgi:hypothetical protein
MRRERQEPGLLLGQGRGHGPGRIAGDPPGVGHRVAPLGELGIQVVHVAEGPRREERVAQVADRAFDAAFFPGRPDGTGAGHAVIVPAQLEQARVEADGVALPLEDGAFQVVVQDDAGHTPQRLKGLDVAAQAALERLVQGEDGVERPRPAQDQHEGGQPPGGAADRDRPEAAPIGLPLLPHQQGQPEIRHGRRGGAQGPHGAAELHDRARIPALAHHLEQPRGAQSRVLLERRLEERPVGVEEARADGGRPGEALGGERPADRVGVQAELGGDRPHSPVLGEEEAANLGDLRRGDHAPAPLWGWAGPPGGIPAPDAVLLPANEPARAPAAPATGPRSGGESLV